MAAHVDSAVQTVLSGSRLLLAHPGNAKLTQVYPTPNETTSVLAQAVNHRGQFRIAPNNTRLGARSDFIVSSSALLSEFAINGLITIPANPNPGDRIGLKPNCIGWGYDLVESIEITFSNSLMQNMFIRGETLKDYMLSTCQTSQERHDMLKIAGYSRLRTAIDAPADFVFTIALAFLNFTPGSLRNSWPVDGSVLAGPIQISINWRSGDFAFIKAEGALQAFPTQFDSLTLSCKTTQLQDASFSVKKSMMLDPQLVYSIPARYLTSVDYSRNLPLGSETAINLSSAPAGMLQGIIISVRPAEPGGTESTNWVTPDAIGAAQMRTGSYPMDKIRLEFGGQNIFRADSHEEYLHFARSNWGDTLETTILYDDEGFEVSTDDVLIHSTYFIPLMNDGCEVLREHTNENLPSYGGSQLQLYLQPAAYPIGLAATASFTRMGNTETRRLNLAVLAEQRFQIWVGWIVSAILEVSQGTVDLQL